MAIMRKSGGSFTELSLKSQPKSIKNNPPSHDYFVHYKGSNHYQDLTSVRSSTESKGKVESGGLQFAHYGRRFGAEAAQLQSPMASEEAVPYSRKEEPRCGGLRPSINNTQPNPPRKMGPDDEPRLPSLVENAKNNRNIENMPKNRVVEYDLEQRMNQNLMRQFKGMFEGEEPIAQPRQHSAIVPKTETHGITPNIYQFITEQDDDCGISEFIEQSAVAAKSRTVATACSGNAQADTRHSMVKMSKTTQNFNPGGRPPTKAGTVSTNLGSNVKKKQFLRNNLPPSASTASKLQNASTAQASMNTSEFVYKRGARSISRKNMLDRNHNGSSVQTKTVPKCEHGKFASCKDCGDRRTSKDTFELKQTRFCARHSKIGCNDCSKVDISDQLSISSHGSNFKTQIQLNRKDQPPLGSRTNLQQRSSNVIRRPETHRKLVKSLPRDEMLGLAHRQSNRPQLPKPQPYRVAKVEFQILDQTCNSSSRNYKPAHTETAPTIENDQELQQNHQQAQKKRLMSSKSNTSAIQRLETQKRLQQSNHGGLIDDRLVRIHEEWQNCDPHDDQFWSKLQNSDKIKKAEMLKGMQVRNQQMDVLSKQSEVFRELQMEDDLNFEMTSLQGGMIQTKSRIRSSSGVRGDYVQNRSIRPSSKESKSKLRQSKQKSGFFTMTAEGEESIAIDIDEQPQTISRKHLIKNNIQVHSQAVFTDYDITDEVPATRPPGFIIKNTTDNVAHDCNIDDITHEPIFAVSKTASQQDIQYWTAMQSQNKSQCVQKGANISNRVREADDSDESDDKPQNRVTKCNISSYDQWLDDQARKEMQTAHFEATIKTAEITSANVKEVIEGFAHSINSNHSKPPVQPERPRTDLSTHYDIQNAQRPPRKKIARKQSDNEDVEVTLESIIQVKDGVQVQMKTVKNPDFINMNANSGTHLGDFISQTSGQVGTTSALVQTFSNDELIYSASKPSMPTQSKPHINAFGGPPSRSRASLRGIREETLEDIESAKLHILSNQDNDENLSSHDVVDHLVSDQKVNVAVTEPDREVWHGGVDRLNKNVKDFLAFEDSADEGPVFDPQPMNQTSNAPFMIAPADISSILIQDDSKLEDATVKVVKTQIEDQSPDIKMRTCDMSKISDLINNIDYNLSQGGMSASFYREKDQNQNQTVSVYDVQPVKVRNKVYEEFEKATQAIKIEAQQSKETVIDCTFQRSTSNKKNPFRTRSPRSSEEQNNFPADQSQVITPVLNRCSADTLARQTSPERSRSPSRLQAETISSQLKRLEKVNYNSKQNKPPLLVKKNQSIPKEKKLESPIPELDSTQDSPKAIKRPSSPDTQLADDRYPSDDEYPERNENPAAQRRPLEPEPDANPYLDWPYPPKPFIMPIIEPDLEVVWLEKADEGCHEDGVEQIDQVDHFPSLQALLDLAAKCKRPSSSYSSRTSKTRLNIAKRPGTSGSQGSFKVQLGNLAGLRMEVKPFTQAQAAVIEEETKSQASSFRGEKPRDMVNAGVQTNQQHFAEIEASIEFQIMRQERIDNPDWALSVIYDEVQFAQMQRAAKGQSSGDCTIQVEAEQIEQETRLHILTEIECDYNADMLKRKLSGKDSIDDGKLFNLYSLGMNTLKALMYNLRLQREWEFQSQNQYSMDLENSAQIDPAETVKLLTRCRKLYEAKSMVQNILKMINQRETMLTQMKTEPEANATGNLTEDQVEKVRRVSDRIAQQINALQEEHRIFKRPFILRGAEYLESMQKEQQQLEEALNQQFYVSDK